MSLEDQPFAVAVAPNGAHRTKQDHPRLPVTAGEIAREAAAAREAGAAMIHFHVRDDHGRHDLDTERYRETIEAVRREVGTDLVVQITTEAAGRYEQTEQIALVDALRPESASLALREVVPDTDAGIAAAAALFERMERAGILHQIIIYEAAELARIDALATRGVLPDGPLALLAVLGRYGRSGATDAEFEAFLNAGLTRHRWMLCAFGRSEAAHMGRAARAGGHARVGFENNLWLPDGRQAPNNAALIAAALDAGRDSGRGVANAQDLRRLWRMPSSSRMEEETASARPRKGPDHAEQALGPDGNASQWNVPERET